MRFAETFKELNGCDATAADILRFERLCRVLETTPTDALLTVFVALDYYQNAYEKMPERIRKESEWMLGNFTHAAETTAAAAFKTSEAAYAAALVKLAEKVAVQATAKSMYKWAAGCTTVVMSILIPALWYAHSVGVETGIARGYNEAKDEKAAAAWANTKEGKSAYRLAQADNIYSFVNCDKPGWYIKNGVCFTGTAADNLVYGWTLP